MLERQVTAELLRAFVQVEPGELGIMHSLEIAHIHAAACTDLYPLFKNHIHDPATAGRP